MNSDFLSLLPGFTSGVKTLHDALAPVVMVMMVAGILLVCVRAMQEGRLSSLMPFLVRCAVIVFLVGSLATLANLIQSGVNDLITQLGLNQLNGNVFAAYRAAVAQRFGTDQAANNTAQATTSANAPATDVALEGDFSAGFSTTPTNTGVLLTHYAYPGDSTPDGTLSEPGSAQGVGAFAPYNTPGSLVPMQSAALTASAAAAYHVQQGQAFTITTSGGQQYNLIYADVAPESDERVDIYDPNGVLGGNNFSQSVTSFNDGPLASTVAGGNPSPMDFLTNPVGTTWQFLVAKLVWLLSLAALGVMWLMSGLQQILFMVEISISPIFLGFLLIPALVSIGTRFMLSLVALCLWPLAWAVCDLLTRALVDLAVNPTSNPAMQPFSIGLMLLGIWVLLAIWVIGSSIFGPWLISRAIIGGSSAIEGVMMGTMGVAAMSAPRVAYQAATLAAGAGAAGAVAGTNGASSIASATRMAPTQNFATRPINNSEPAQKS